MYSKQIERLRSEAAFQKQQLQRCMKELKIYQLKVCLFFSGRSILT
jgi:hypothetical protein